MTNRLATAVGVWREAWRRLSPAARATTIFLVAMIAAGVVLRIEAIGNPPHFTFDEQFFVPNGRRYLVGVPDDNDHPPLGKLFIAVGILLLGDNPIGWRAASLILGLETLVVGFWLARVLFEDRRAGWFAAAFLAADGFPLAYSRTALLDGGLTCLVLASVLAAATARSWRGVMASAVLVGLATSVKWSGALAVVPAAAAVLALRRAPRATLALFALAPVVHVLVWLGGFALTGRPVSLPGLGRLMLELFHHHVALGKKHNALASPWYSWLILYHPIVVKLSNYGTRQRYASSAGNPLLFYTTTLVIVGGVLGGVAATGVRVWRRARTGWSAARWWSGATARATGLLAVGWLALLAPWIFGRGTYVFWYHYLPPYAFALVLIGGLAARAERRWPRGIALYVGIALLIALYFAPVWGELPIGLAAANRRLIFIPWRP